MVDCTREGRVCHMGMTKVSQEENSTIVLVTFHMVNCIAGSMLLI